MGWILRDEGGGGMWLGSQNCVRYVTRQTLSFSAAPGFLKPDAEPLVQLQNVPAGTFHVRNVMHPDVHT